MLPGLDATPLRRDWLKLMRRAMSNGGAASARSALQVGNKGHHFGLTLSNNATDVTNDIDISAGEAVDSTAAVLMPLASGVTRQLDVAFGTGTGGRFDSAIADGTWHVFLIGNGSTVNVGFSQSLTPTGAANYPGGFPYFRRIGSIVRLSGAILPFVQDGDHFLLKTPILDVALTAPGSSANTPTLSAIPNGIRVGAKLTALIVDTASVDTVYLSDLSTVDLAPNGSAAPGFTVRSSNAGSSAAADAEIMTNTSRQIRYRVQTGAATSTMRIVTRGWRDTRGREA